MRIVAVHLLNDYSGSPKVLMQLLKIWQKNNYNTHLFICKGGEGFLSDIDNIRTHHYSYRFSKLLLVRLFFFLISQIDLAIKLMFFLKKGDVVYINTVLPFGAALMAKLKGCKIIYHIHETSVKPALFKKFLFLIAKKTCHKVVYVSQFIAKQEPISKNSEILYNVLEEDFIKKTSEINIDQKEEKIVLMICSLKKYKGIEEFIDLAFKNKQYTFKLVLNASSGDIESYFGKKFLPKNLKLYPTQKNTIPFYKEASIILNLSDVKTWVETFGLTILEGMSFGLPAIVPPVGGVTELVEEGVNGYCINSKNTQAISDKIKLLLSYKDLYTSFSNNALQKSKMFSTQQFEEKSLEIISKL